MSGKGAKGWTLEKIQEMIDFDDAPNLKVVDPDPNMFYTFAAKDKPEHPQSVEACQRLGYEPSDRKHNSTDCELMEIPLAVFEGRRNKKRAAKRELRKQPPRPRGVPQESQVEGLNGLPHGMTERTRN